MREHHQACDALVYREEFLNVATASNTAGKTGQWPDPLMPIVDAFYGEKRNALPVTVAAGQTQGFWVELLVPAHAGAGHLLGQASRSPTRTSRPRPSTSRFRCGASRCPRPPRSAAPTASTGTDRASATSAATARPTATTRSSRPSTLCTSRTRSTTASPSARSCTRHPSPTGMGDFTTFDTLYGPFLDGTALTGKNTLQGAKITAIAYTGDQVAASYAAWATHFKAKGWFDRVFDYTCDEPPNGCAWTDIPTRAAIVHVGDPTSARSRRRPSRQRR